MNVPLDISFQGLSHSRALEAVVIENANGLTHVRHGIERCRVILDHGALATACNTRIPAARSAFAST